MCVQEHGVCTTRASSQHWPQPALVEQRPWARPGTSTQGVRAAGGLVNAVLGAASLLSASFQKLLEA